MNTPRAVLLARPDAIIELAPKDGRSRLTLLPNRGGVCHELVFTTSRDVVLPVLAGCTAEELARGNPWYRGAWLYPFASRLPEGRYTWAGRTYEFPLNDPTHHSAIHGMLERLPARLTHLEAAATSASAKLVIHYDGSEPGYPFPSQIRMEYHLESRGALTITFAVTNHHTESVPVSVGWHPYFTLPGQPNDWQLQLPAGELVELNAHLLPTGSASPAHGFEQGRMLGDLAIDAPVKLSRAGRNQTTLWSPGSEVGVLLWQDAGSSISHGYKYLQVFVPPDRQAIAMEPVSSAINAFNSGNDLGVLPPGDTLGFTCGVELIERQS